MQQIVTLCDVCGGAAQPLVAAFGERAEPRVVDLCDAHRAELTAALVTLLDEHGRRLPPTTKPAAAEPKALNPNAGREHADDPLICILCDATFPSLGKLGYHIGRAHDVSGPLGLYGSAVCPLCGIDFAGDHKPPQAMTALGSHGKMHQRDGSGIHGLYREAAKAGDPHGVIAKRLADLGITKKAAA